MDTYRKTLVLLKDIFKTSGHSHWENWIDRDIYEWDNFKSTSHHKSAFGGMGSINDIAVGERDRVGVWKNNMFDSLKSLSWTLAAINEIRFEKPVISVIEGSVCRDCLYALIAESGVEHFLSRKYLPSIIADNLLTDNYLILTDFNKLTNIEFIEVDRQKLLEAFKTYGINYSEEISWLRDCPNCGTKNTCVYRWDITYVDNKVKIAKSIDNVSIKVHEHILSWLKRFFS